MKKIMLFFTCFCLFMLGGCKSYERDSSAGEIVQISVAQLQEKIDQKESFAVVFTQSFCTHCQLMKEMLDDYLPTHHVILYEVMLDKDPNPDFDGNLKLIQETFTELSGTPELYYVDHGEASKKVEYDSEELTEKVFDNFVQAYQLDEVKEKE